MKKTISLEFTGFYVSGYINVNHWGGGEGCILMDDVTLTPTELDTFDFKDTSFGVESIENGAEVHIYAVYENPEDCTVKTKQFLKDLYECSKEDVIEMLHLYYDEMLVQNEDAELYKLFEEA